MVLGGWGSGIRGLRFKVSVFGFRIQGLRGLGCGFPGLASRASGFRGLRLWYLGFGV